MDKKNKNCLHCGDLCLATANHFCCSACEIAYQIVSDNNLDFYYDLKPEKKMQEASDSFSYTQKSKIKFDFENPQELQELELSIQGIQCAACVWLIEKLATQMGELNLQVDVASAQLKLEFRPQNFDVKKYLNLLENLGYHCSLKEDNAPSENNLKQQDLKSKWIFCLVLALNAMMLSLPVYLGFKETDSYFYQLIHWLSLGIASIIFIYGASFFFKKAWISLKHGMIHLDLAISVALFLSFLGSLYLFFSQEQRPHYFDTLNIFIALMLLGRYLQEVFIEKNRNSVAELKSIDHFTVTRMSSSLEEIECQKIKKGDRLFIRPGEIIPVKSKLVNRDKALFSLAWISGESEAVEIFAEEIIKSGAINIDQDAFELEALENFQEALLQKLAVENSLNLQSHFWEKFSRYYLIGLFLSASLAGIFWSSQSFLSSIQVVTAMLVVACPCSIGISIPILQFLMNKRLVKKGIFVLNPKLFDQLAQIKNLVFDKTGTLSQGKIKIANIDELKNLSSTDLQVIFNLCAHSSHPLSQALFQSLVDQKLDYIKIQTSEKVGLGLNSSYQGADYFIGKCQVSRKTIIRKNNKILIELQISEDYIDDLKSSITDLKNMAYQIFILSGDRESRVKILADKLELNSKNFLAESSPEQKKKFIDQIDPQLTMMIGDGINDNLAFQNSRVSALALNARMQSHIQTDFYFLNKNLNIFPYLFQISKKFIFIRKINILFFILYNFTVLSFAASAYINPLLAAILMPLSSIFILTFSLFLAREEGKTKWKFWDYSYSSA